MKLYNPFAKTLSGSLQCPVCQRNNNKGLKETNRRRGATYDFIDYRCKQCGLEFIYQHLRLNEYKDPERFNAVYGNPYHAFGKTVEDVKRFSRQITIGR